MDESKPPQVPGTSATEVARPLPARPLDSEAETLAGQTRQMKPRAPRVAAPRSDRAAVTITAVHPATRADRYEGASVLGEGGMGTVFLCDDQRIGRRIAMKVLHAEFAADAHASARFVREAQVQGQLEHPSVVPVYDLGFQDDGPAYFTMKRVRGVTLADIVVSLAEGKPDAEQKYSRRRLLAAFASVCLAVDYAHEHGVLHRDLKPGNLMLGDYGEVYVLDWGLAKIASSADGPSGERPAMPTTQVETLAGAVLGTPGYMSPEQVRGEELTPRSDVYALGAILFEILTLMELHARATIHEMLSSTLRGADARPSVRAPDRDVPPELEAICVRATALEPAARHADARELHEAVQRYLDGERDVERRKELAQDHARSAADAAAQSVASASSLDGRQRAMREIGRALALDPSNADAMRTMVSLLTAPPKYLPKEVAQEIEEGERLKTRWVGRFGAVAYASTILYMPLLLWMGLRATAPVIAVYAFAALATGLSATAALFRRPSPLIVLAVLVASSISFSLTWSFFGPFFFGPALIAINTTAFAAHVQRVHRAFVIAVGTLAVLVPIVLEIAGVIGPTYSFHDGALTIAPRALTLAPTPTLAFLAITSIGLVLTSAVSVVRIRGALSEAEQQLLVYAWHLRAFVSEPGAKPSTPPRA